jgi:hypothetical protein
MRVGLASGSARSRRPGCGPRVVASRQYPNSRPTVNVIGSQDLIAIGVHDRTAEVMPVAEEQRQSPPELPDNPSKPAASAMVRRWISGCS